MIIPMLKKPSCTVHLPKVYLVQETEFRPRSSASNAVLPPSGCPAIFKMFSEEALRNTHFQCPHGGKHGIMGRGKHHWGGGQ